MSLYREFKEYGQVFSLTFPQAVVTFRKMTIEECRILEKIKTMYGTIVELETENELFSDICIGVEVYQDDTGMGTTEPPEMLDAGIISSTVMVSYHLSKMGNHKQINQVLQTIRKHLESDFYGQTKLLILKAFPQLDPTDVDRLNGSKMLEYAVYAESILGLEKPIEASPPRKQRKQ